MAERTKHVWKSVGRHPSYEEYECKNCDAKGVWYMGEAGIRARDGYSWYCKDPVGAKSTEVVREQPVEVKAPEDWSYQYIRFVLIEKKPKTNVYACLNLKRGTHLGKVKWSCPWRQYCFFPEGHTIFSNSCLADIQDFIKKLR